MIYDILYRGKITLVDGGMQRRSFTWIGDGIEGLIKIVENKDGRAAGEIFNIGNPGNNYSIREMAEMLIDEMKKMPVFQEKAASAVLEDVSADKYYGKTYDDIQNRLPSIDKMESSLGWKPKTDMCDILKKTLYWYAVQEKIN